MKVKIYGSDWCSDCINAKQFLQSHGVIFEYIDISNDIQAASFVEKVNNGKRVIPTIEINGKTHINPGFNKLIKIIKE